MKAIAIIADGFEEIELVGTVDLLRRAQFTVDVCCIKQQKSVKGVTGITIFAEKTLSEININDYRLVFLPGGSKCTEELQCKEVIDLLLKHEQNKGYFAAICAAPKVLKKADLLVRFTCYPSLLEGATNERVVVCDRVITSQGPGTVFEFAFAIVQVLMGNDAVERLKKQIVHY